MLAEHGAHVRIAGLVVRDYRFVEVHAHHRQSETLARKRGLRFSEVARTNQAPAEKQAGKARGMRPFRYP